MLNRILFKLMNFWPPYLGAGIRIKSISTDFLVINVEMKLRFWNKNIFGTQFGGSLYSMVDPFLVLILNQNLGKKYIIWDKAAVIRFKKPGISKVKATLSLTRAEIETIKEKTASGEKYEPHFLIHITDDLNNIIAEIEKTLYIKIR